MLDAYDYPLPERAIAQHPIEPRDAARLLVALTDELEDRHVRDLPSFIRRGDLIVVNDTRVLPARLHLRKHTGGQAEVFLVEKVDEQRWHALIRPARRLPAGTVLERDDGTPQVSIDAQVGDVWEVTLLRPVEEAGGEVPLPPYIHEPLADPERYQTVYAAHPGSVAAPTAGLHLTEDVLRRCREQGAQIAKIDLTVGLDTFRPVSDLATHRMHSEAFRVPEDVWQKVRTADRVIAIGTTTVRALETTGATGALEGRTDVFIRAGWEFRVVDVLLTNFHLPRSTLLMLVEAFAGPRWRALYEEALTRGYRFLSFGDAMLLGRRS